jgi:hypothetical protein
MGVATSLIASGVAWYFKGPNAGLVVAGVGIAIFIAMHLFGRQEQQSQLPPRVTQNAQQEANPQITQQFNPQFNPTIQIGVLGDSGRSAPSALNNQKHEELVIEFLRTKPPHIGFGYAEVAANTNLPKRDARSALERLEAQGSVWSVGQLDVEGGKAYFLDDVERTPAPEKKDKPRCNIQFLNVEVNDMGPDAVHPIERIANAIFENEFIDGEELRTPKVKARLIFRREDQRLILDLSNVAWFQDQLRYIEFPANTPRELPLFFMDRNSNLFVRSMKMNVAHTGELGYEDHLLTERFDTVEVQLLTENERLYRKLLKFADDGTNFPRFIEAIN